MNIIQRIIQITLFLILLVAVACSDSQTIGERDGLAETTWEWQKAVYSDGIVYEPHSADVAPYIRFTSTVATDIDQGLTYEANMGCEAQGGAYVMAGDGQVELLKTEETAEGWDVNCQPVENIANEVRWLEAYPIIKRYERIDNTLRLYSDNFDVFVFSLKAVGDKVVDTNAGESPIWGPAVISNDAETTITMWRYVSPYALDVSSTFPSNYPGAVAVGEDKQDVSVIWHESGFYIVWSGFYCAREPILIIDESNNHIALWKNENVFADCEAAEAKHMLEVRLETTVPQEDWTFSIERAAP